VGFRGSNRRGTGGGKKSIESRLSRYGDEQRRKSQAAKEKKAAEPEKPEKEK